MNFFSLWGITIITSSICELINEIKIFKDFADNGYKFNIEKMKNIENSILPGTATNSNMSMMIPFYNLYTVMKRKMLYEQNKEIIFDQYEKLGILEEMTEEEKEEYSKKPTGWNAIVIAAQNSNTNEIKKVEQPKITNNDKQQIVKMIIKEEDGQINTITVRMDMTTSNDKLEILELIGPVKDFPRDEMVAYVLKHMDLIMQGKNISLKKTEELIEITLTKVKPKTKLERYIELRDSLKEQGYLIGEEMFEYQDLKEELGPTLNLTK